MSLNWSLQDALRKEEALSEKGWQWTQVVIFETMLVGMGEITEKNVTDFISRSEWVRKLQSRVMIPRESILCCIGLTTNVSQESLNAWIKRTAFDVYNEIRRDVSHQILVEGTHNLRRVHSGT